jgi:hypothetical protein
MGVKLPDVSVALNREEGPVLGLLVDAHLAGRLKYSC